MHSRTDYLAVSGVAALVLAFATFVVWAGWNAWENSYLVHGTVADKRYVPAHDDWHPGHTSVTTDSQGHTHTRVTPGYWEHVPDRWSVTITGPHPNKPEKTLRRTLHVTESVYDKIRTGEDWTVGNPASRPLTAEYEP